MARVSAHGHEIGTVEFTTKAKRYMSDGTILVNKGFGWKIGPKLKPGVTPEQAYASQKAKQEQFLRERPFMAAYRKALHDLAGLSKRWKLDLAVSVMPQDPDGVWSEACDGYSDNIHADISEICELCNAYQLAVRECEQLKQPA